MILVLNLQSVRIRKVMKNHSDWTFHLVGKDFEDDYSMEIKKLIVEYDLENNVFLYGSRQDVENILNLTSIAILTSKSEGLPVSVLEYGLYKKPIVVTRVGEIPAIIQHEKNGFVVDSNEPDLFYNYLEKLITEEQLCFNFGQALYNTVQSDYTAKSVINKYLKKK